MEKTWSKELEKSKARWSGQRIPGEQPLSDEAIRSFEAVLSMFSSGLLGFVEQIFDQIEFQVDPVKNLCTLSFSKMASSDNKAVSHQTLNKVWPGAGPFGKVSGSIFLINDIVAGAVLAEGHIFMLRFERYENAAANDGDNFKWKFEEV
jgi:hypothetical protein